MKMFDDKLKKINEKSEPFAFINEEHLFAYVKDRNINDRQEFWFYLYGDACLYCSVFEYCYEG